MAAPSSRYPWFVLAVCALSAMTCETGPTNPAPAPVPLSELESAPDTIEVSGIRLTLWTFLWRDFQPVAPPDGKPLVALIRLVEPDSAGIPEGVIPRAIWILDGHQVWTSRFSDEDRPPRPEWEIERIARNGPKWGPGIEVDVVVGVRASDGPMQLVAARGRPIHRTD